MVNRNAAWLTPATSRSCAAALMTTGWEPTDSMSSTTFGSWRVMIQGAPLKMAGSAASIPDASLPHIGWPPTRSTPDAAAQSLEHVAHGTHRRGDHDDVSDVDHAEVRVGDLHNSSVHRLPDHRRIAIAAHDRMSFVMQRERERRAHEAETDYGNGRHYDTKRAVWPSRRAGA